MKITHYRKYHTPFEKMIRGKGHRGGRCFWIRKQHEMDLFQHCAFSGNTLVYFAYSIPISVHGRQHRFSWNFIVKRLIKLIAVETVKRERLPEALASLCLWYRICFHALPMAGWITMHRTEIVRRTSITIQQTWRSLSFRAKNRHLNHKSIRLRFKRQYCSNKGE